MSSLTIARAAIRTNSAALAQYLAVALAVTIPLSNALTTVLSLLLALTCVMQMDRTTWLQVLKHPITIAVLIFVGLNLLDTAYSISAPKELSLTLRKYARLLYFPLLLPLFTQAKWRQYAAIGFIAAVFTTVVAAIYMGHAVFKDTIFTSLFISYGIFMLAHYAYDNKSTRWFTISLASAFTFYLLFMGYGRAGQFLFILLALLFIWQRLVHSSRQVLLSVLLLSLIVAASILAPSSFSDRNAKAWSEIQQYTELEEADIPHNSSMGTRLILAHNSWELIKLKPIFGWGTGAFTAAYEQYAPEMQVKDVKRANPHNQYLLTWVELGLPGLCSLLFMFGTAAWLFMRSKSIEGYLGLGLICAIAVGCGMNSWLLDYTSGFFFVFFMAVFAAANFRQHQ